MASTRTVPLSITALLQHNQSPFKSNRLPVDLLTPTLKPGHSASVWLSLNQETGSNECQPPQEELAYSHRVKESAPDERSRRIMGYEHHSP
ncbi:uncharacterized protein L203_102461 [Cryptococcus depauperatus CBS 7841]|uniref:Uncharacterized protein n=1 Tax=Cryptococcus depauperatus CBS 7841 TaxID=1295531 RepID=A0AAJ8M0P8_9TREE